MVRLGSEQLTRPGLTFPNGPPDFACGFVGQAETQSADSHVRQCPPSGGPSFTDRFQTGVR